LKLAQLHLKVEDAIADVATTSERSPRDESDDYSREVIQRRRAYVARQSGAQLKHILRYSFDPHIAKGNCESFVGVAQVPMGFAGPLRVNGEAASGEFLIPLATSEGTLQAANGITAMFIATGQDVANVAESSAGPLYAELTRSGDLYVSLTIPSRIVATHGGGTGLAT
jgi:hydroxymethylglutaryl-CoA reductase (NADPH)